MTRYILKFFVNLFFLLNSQNLYASKLKNYKVGDIILEHLEITNKKKFKLPDGEWTVLDREGYAEYGLNFNCLSLIQSDKKEILGGLEICFVSMAGVYVGHLDSALIEAMFKDPHDGCYERPEYYLLELYRKGSTHNCFIVRHNDIMKELYNPDDPSDRQYSASLKQWMRDNPEIKIPPIMLSSIHWYFSRTVDGNWIGINYLINPKLLDSPGEKYLTEETSEYHKYNIDEFPEHKKIMKKWISISAKRHIEFEKVFKSKSRHKLKLDKYILK